MLRCQLLLQKEREDATASYKSAQATQASQSKENNVPGSASAPSAQELASRENSPADRMSALQALSAFAHPVAAELLRERSSPNFTAGFQRMPATTSSIETTAGPTDCAGLGFSRQMSDSAVSFAGAYRGFRSSDDATAAMHRSLDSSCPPALKLTDTMPQFLAQHSFPGADGPSSRSLAAFSDVGNPAEMLSASVVESRNEQSHMEFKAAYGGIPDEAVHNYGNISGTIVIHFVWQFSFPDCTVM